MDMLFVGGCGHSGTSLITAMLGAHSKIHALTNETYAFLHLEAEKIPDFFAEKIAEAREESDAWYLCEKSPNHILFVDAIRNLYPDAPIVAVTRDPRDVGLSQMRRGKTLDQAIRSWRRANRHIRDAEGLIEFRYEDLIDDPEGTLSTICDDIGICYEPAMLRYREDEREWFSAKGRFETEGSTVETHRIRRNWQIHQPLMDRRGLWREGLTPAQVAKVEQRCERLMRHFNYALETRPDEQTQDRG